MAAAAPEREPARDVGTDVGGTAKNVTKGSMIGLMDGGGEATKEIGATGRTASTTHRPGKPRDIRITGRF